MAEEADPILTVDDLVCGKANDWLGEGVLPSKAILIVETISEAGTGIRFALSEGLMTWQALGMLRCITMRVEDADIDAWGDDEE